MAVAVGNVLGWGYEGRTADELVAFAVDHAAHTVVDVRLNAVSRKRGFSKRNLDETLGAAGLTYVHFRALGNPRDNRDGFASPRSAAGTQAHHRFASEVLRAPEAQEALKRLAELTQVGNVVLLCYEADGSLCHRSLVVSALSAAMFVDA